MGRGRKPNIIRRQQFRVAPQPRPDGWLPGRNGLVGKKAEKQKSCGATRDRAFFA
jgi:hypothetical protein